MQIATTTSIEEAPIEPSQNNVGRLRRQLEGEGKDGEEDRDGGSEEDRPALRLRTSATGERSKEEAKGEAADLAEDDEGHAVAPMLSQPEHLLIPAISAPRGNGLNQQSHGEEHAVTPDLTSFGSGGGGSDDPLSMSRSGQCGNAMMQPPKMFNIFLPKSQQRVRSVLLLPITIAQFAI